MSVRRDGDGDTVAKRKAWPTVESLSEVDLVRQLLPMSPLTGDLGVADLAVLERFADPNNLVKLGRTRLTTLIA